MLRYCLMGWVSVVPLTEALPVRRNGGGYGRGSCGHGSCCCRNGGRPGGVFLLRELLDLRLELVDGLLQLDGVGLIDLGYDYTFDDNLNVSYN